MAAQSLATKQSRTLFNAKQTITRLIYYGLLAGTFRRIQAETGNVGMGAHPGR